MLLTLIFTNYFLFQAKTVGGINGTICSDYDDDTDTIGFFNKSQLTNEKNNEK